MAKKRGFEHSNPDEATQNISRKKSKNEHPQNHNRAEASRPSQSRQRHQARPRPLSQRDAEYHPQAYDPDRIHSAVNTVQLPPIHDDAMRKAVFTHQGTLGAKDSLESSLSYERLEYLGDAYIEIIASKLVYDRFPKLGPGKLSGLRELLVKNETLAAIAIEYEFDRGANLPDSHRNMGSKLFEKTMGDITEAYVAAVILSDPENGYASAEAWLTQLWNPLLQDRDEAYLPPKLAKQELAKRLGGKDVLIQYLDAKLFGRDDGGGGGGGQRRYSVGVYLTGWGWNDQLLGFGEGWSKLEAGNHAALTALSNVPLIEDIAGVKKAFDAETRAKREAQELETAKTDMTADEMATAPEV